MIEDNVTDCITGSRYCEGANEENVNSNNETTSGFPVQSAPPSRAPVQEVLPNCTVDDDGNYQSTGMQLRERVTFQYQVQTTRNQDVETMNGQTLSLIEKKLSSLLVAAIWNGLTCQAVEDAGLQRGILQDVLDGSVSGLLAAPVDEVVAGVEGGKAVVSLEITEYSPTLSKTHLFSSLWWILTVTCLTDLVDGAENCFIVDGGFTLLADLAEEDISWAVDPTLFATELLLNNGELDDVHPDVIEVRFISKDVDAVNGTERGTVGIAAAEGDDLQAWPFVVLSLGALFLAGGAIGLRRKQLRRGQN